LRKIPRGWPAADGSGSEEQLHRDESSVSTQPSFTASQPRLLFTGLYAGHSAEDALREYDVTPDGRSFVMIREVAPKSKATQLNVVLGWSDELRKASTAERR